MKVAVNGKLVDVDVPILENPIEQNYEQLVESFIREKYSLSAELAILRQRDSKPEEFAEYNAYAEQCKSKAKKLLEI